MPINRHLRHFTQMNESHTIISIGSYAFSGCSSLKDIYYGGSQEQWGKIEIASDGNECLKTAAIHYASGQKSSQTITAKDITVTYGAKPFSLNAQVNTGTVLTYSVSDQNVATVDKAGTVTIKGCGVTSITITAPQTEDYSQAQKTIMLTVKPKKMTLSSAKSKKKKTAIVKWKKDATASGYIIECALDGKFKKNIVRTDIKKNKTVSTTVKKLKPGKKYFVRICAYVKSGSTKIQGDWSKTKTVKVKK